MPSGSDKVIYAALAGNILVAISKFVAAAFTASPAMLAEAFHSTADSGNELLLMIGRKRSRRPPDQQHPFGHGMELYFWAFIVAMSIFAVGGGLSIYEGIDRLIHPTPLQAPTWNYVVIGLAAVFEGYSWNVSRRELNRRSRKGESLLQVIRRSKDPSVYTVFIEDSTALLGLLVAFLGILLSHQFAAPFLDATASIIIGLLLVLAAAALAIETGGLLVGEGADPQQLRELRRIIESADAVQQVGDLLTLQLGPDEVLLVADVNFRRELGTAQLEQSIDEIERRVRDRYSSVTRIFFEAESLRNKNRESPAA